jgi:hypothetical protein
VHRKNSRDTYLALGAPQPVEADADHLVWIGVAVEGWEPVGLEVGAWFHGVSSCTASDREPTMAASRVT